MTPIGLSDLCPNSGRPVKTADALLNGIGQYIVECDLCHRYVALRDVDSFTGAIPRHSRINPLLVREAA